MADFGVLARTMEAVNASWKESGFDFKTRTSGGGTGDVWSAFDASTSHVDAPRGRSGFATRISQDSGPTGVAPPRGPASAQPRGHAGSDLDPTLHAEGGAGARAAASFNVAYSGC